MLPRGQVGDLCSASGSGGASRAGSFVGRRFDVAGYRIGSLPLPWRQKIRHGRRGAHIGLRLPCRFRPNLVRNFRGLDGGEIVSGRRHLVSSYGQSAEASAPLTGGGACPYGRRALKPPSGAFDCRATAARENSRPDFPGLPGRLVWWRWHQVGKAEGGSGFFALGGPLTAVGVGLPDTSRRAEAVVDLGLPCSSWCWARQGAFSRWLFRRRHPGGAVRVRPIGRTVSAGPLPAIRPKGKTPKKLQWKTQFCPIRLQNPPLWARFSVVHTPGGRPDTSRVGLRPMRRTI